jgi:putative oxidoreductase
LAIKELYGKQTAMKILKPSLIINVSAALFILLFTYTGISKLTGHDKFENVLSRSPLLEKFSAIISWLVPVIELAIATLLFFPSTKKSGIRLSLLLMSLFTAYIAYMLLFIPHLPCSCGGVLQKLNWKQHLLFNIGFTVLAAYNLWLYKRDKLFIAINRSS